MPSVINNPAGSSSLLLLCGFFGRCYLEAVSPSSSVVLGEAPSSPAGEVLPLPAGEPQGAHVPLCLLSEGKDSSCARAGACKRGCLFRGDVLLAGSAGRLSRGTPCECFPGFLPALHWVFVGEDKSCCFGCPRHSPSRISWNSSPDVLLLRLPLALPATSSERALSAPRARHSGT